MCNGPSPEITLTNLPVGAVDLRVTLCNLDHPMTNHGGGTFKNDLGGKKLPDVQWLSCSLTYFPTQINDYKSALRSGTLHGLHTNQCRLHLLIQPIPRISDKLQ